MSEHKFNGYENFNRTQGYAALVINKKIKTNRQKILKKLIFSLTPIQLIV
jgi:hypothetical protein